MLKIFRKLFTLCFAIGLMFSSVSPMQEVFVTTVMADETSTDGTASTTTDAVPEKNSDEKYDNPFDDETNKGETRSFIFKLFGGEKFTTKNMAVALNLTSPLVQLSATLTLGILVLSFYFSVFQTAVDLSAFLFKPIRVLLLRRTQENGANRGNAFGGHASGDKSFCLSDAAMEILLEENGGGSNMMGAGYNGERSNGGKSKLFRYSIVRAKEMSVLITFFMIFFTPMLGLSVLSIFEFLTDIISSIPNLLV